MISFHAISVLIIGAIISYLGFQPDTPLPILWTGGIFIGSGFIMGLVDVYV